MTGCSRLHYDQRNGDQGLRRWNNVAGFNSISTYPDWLAGSYGGLALDRRLVWLGVRAIADMQQIAIALGIPEVMSFNKATDAESGLTLTAVSYEEPGTGNVLLSMAILYGLHVGNGGGSALAQTDLAGLLLKN
ncbi:MAG TPA: hypothetical protein VFE51_14130 [Verrucomicrobiae bacterium]|nr:hypothetical protein [Verrucomicrobiae bacterium]